MKTIEKDLLTIRKRLLSTENPKSSSKSFKRQFHFFNFFLEKMTFAFESHWCGHVSSKGLFDLNRGSFCQKFPNMIWKFPLRDCCISKVS